MEDALPPVSPDLNRGGGDWNGGEEFRGGGGRRPAGRGAEDDGGIGYGR